jgi:hydrogenase nickel incorporation protein HypB
MFHSAHVMVINKTDLLDYCDFSVEKVVDNARSLNPDVTILETSCRTGDGLEDWIRHVREFVAG